MVGRKALLSRWEQYNQEASGMKQNLVSRDLLLLAAVAFHRQMFDKAGSLFAAAMQSADTMELLKELDPDGVVTSSIQLLQPGEIAENEAITDNAGDAPRIGLSAIAKSVGDAMSFVSNSAVGEDEDGDEDQDEEDDEDSASDNNDDPADDTEDDSEPEDSDDDTVSDDFDPDAAGQKVIPSSLSSGAAHQGGGSAVAGTKIKLVMGTARSPVRVK